MPTPRHRDADAAPSIGFCVLCIEASFLIRLKHVYVSCIDSSSRPLAFSPHGPHTIHHALHKLLDLYN